MATPPSKSSSNAIEKAMKEPKPIGIRHHQKEVVNHMITAANVA